MRSLDTRLKRLRIRLLQEQPFFGVLGFRLGLSPDPSTESMATNGRVIKYNPQWCDAQSDEILLGVLAHEIMHCAMGHHARRGHREVKRWNYAADFAINPILIDAGLKLPTGVLIDPRFKGQSAERIYSQITNDDGDGGNCPGEVEDLPGENGEPCASESETTHEIQEWNIASEQSACMADAMGKLAGGIGRAVQDARKETVDWKAVLQDFVQRTVPSDYSLMRPNRKFLAHGIYMPGLVKENMGTLVIGVDVSGSIGDEVLSQFASEINAINQSVRPEAIHVVYCDDEVQNTTEYTAHDEIKLSSNGGGATDFTPVFDWVEHSGISPVAMIYLTDMYGRFPQSAPDYPVLWCSTSGVHTAPFGDVVPVEV